MYLSIFCCNKKILLQKIGTFAPNKKGAKTYVYARKNYNY